MAELAELAEEEEFLGHQKSPWKFPHGQFIGNLDSVVRISKLWYLLAGKHMKRHHLGRIFYCWHGHLHGYLQTWPMIVLQFAWGWFWFDKPNGPATEQHKFYDVSSVSAWHVCVRCSICVDWRVVYKLFDFPPWSCPYTGVYLQVFMLLHAPHFICTDCLLFCAVACGCSFAYAVASVWS